MRKTIAGVLITALLLTGCAGAADGTAQSSQEQAAAEVEETQEQAASESGEGSEAQTASEEQTTQKAEETTGDKGDFVILYTNDVHCAVEDTIGYAGLSAYKKALEEEGNEVFLVDDGDMIQGGVFGTVTRGEAVIDLMNDVGYDLAIPGNHEFDYGVDWFLDLTEEADFPFISCNFKDLRTGELVFDPYVIKEIGGRKFGFIGVTTPLTFTSSTPAFFMDENKNFIYSFGEGDDGNNLYRCVQEAVDEVNKEGVDYTVLIAHLGIEESAKPYMSVDVIRNTTGIDLVLDGHSHSTVPMEEVKNKDGQNVVLTQSGSHLAAIGKVTIDQSGAIKTELITDWEEKDPVIVEDIEEERVTFSDILSEKLTYSDFDLAAKEEGQWLVRNNETNLGDLFADAFKYVTGADIGMINSGGIRSDIPAGDITYEDALKVAPFCNETCCIRISGQMLADALEYGVHSAPEPFGGFLQVSGVTFDVDLDKNAQVERDANGLFVAFGSDERRVSNIMVNGEPLDPDREYTVGGIKYNLINHGDGLTFFDGAEVVELDRYILDVDVLAEYLKSLGDKVPEQYADRYGEERIHFISD